MKQIKSILVVAVLVLVGCASESDKYNINHYPCTFEGTYWDGLVDANLNKDKLVEGSFAKEWHDEKSDLVGEVVEPFPGYWEGVAISNFCSKEPDSDGTYEKQLYAYVEKPHSGKNFLICNGFMSGYVELRFASKTSFIESMMVANTTYSRNATGNGYRTADRPLGDKESIWIEAVGFVNGSDEVQATAKFYLYKNGKPAFEGWKKWYMTSMCKIDRLRMYIKWDGKEEYNPYPAYFALDDIVVVRQELKEELK
jgi:hypothetical protein